MSDALSDLTVRGIEATIAAHDAKGEQPASSAALSSGSNEGAAVRAGDEAPVEQGADLNAAGSDPMPFDSAGAVRYRTGPARTTQEHPADTTAIAIIVAPENTDEVVQALPADQLLRFIFFCEEIVRRANAAKKGAIIEAVMAAQRGEISPLLEVNGHRYELREDRRSDWDDIPGLLYTLNRQGASITDLASAVSSLRVTDLERVCASLDDDVRADAYETVKAHRVFKSTSPALVDLDSPWRRKSGKKEEAA